MLTFAISSMISCETFGQVGISDTGTLIPDSNAVFELGSVSKGALLPRLTTEEIKTIYLPPDGLLVYNTDSSMFYYYDSGISSWRNFQPGNKIIVPVCGSPFLDDRNNKLYPTILIGTQCWMGGNLDIGTLIPSSQAMQNNNTLEKYCYNNSADSCAKYGALYTWDETMQYVTTEGTQGICPAGWHIPSDNEWKVLEGNADSQYGVGDPIWDEIGERGFDVGKKLKSVSGWYMNGNGVDLYNFAILPGGMKSSTSGNMYLAGSFGYFWVSNEYDAIDAIGRIFRYVADDSYWNIDSKTAGYSVRCLKNY